MEIRRINIYIWLFLFIFTPSFSSLYGATLSKPANNLGLVGYWSFDEATGTVATDFSGRGNNGTLTNMSAPASASSGWGNGILDGGINFDGSNDYIDMGDPASGSLDFDINSPATFSFWINRVSASETAAPIVKRTSGGSGYSIDITTAGVVSFTIGDNFSTNSRIGRETSTTLNLNQWYHVVVTYSGSGSSTGIDVYFDGVSQTMTNAFDNFTGVSTLTSTSFALGSRGSGIERRLSGKLDEVRVYTRLLSATEIKNLYNSGVVKFNSSNNNVVKNGLVSHWTFDGKDFTDKVYDVSGNGINGYVFGGATSTLKKVGKIGQSVYFNNSAPYINVGSPASLDNLSQKTVTMWVSRSALNQNQLLVDKLGPSGNQGWVINARGSIFGSGPNTIRYEHTWNASPSEFAIWYGSTLLNSTSTWYHVAVSYDSSSTSNVPKIYVNGVSDTVTTGQAAVGTSKDDSGSNVLMGTDGTTSEFHYGGLDDVRIYNRILTDAEVKQIYNATVGSKLNSSQNVFKGSSLGTGLVGYWPFNGLDITTTIHDRSGSSNDAYFVGRATTTAKTIGKSGQGLDFNGLTDFVVLNAVANDITATSFTFGAWVKTTPCINFCTLLAVNTSSLGNETQLFLDSSTFVSVYDGTDDATEITSSVAVADDSWHHIVYKRSGSTGTLYVDGVSQGTHSSSDTFSSTDLWSLGQEWDFGTVASDFLKGKIDEVRLYSRVLTDSEIKQLYLMGK